MIEKTVDAIIENLSKANTDIDRFVRQIQGKEEYKESAQAALKVKIRPVIQELAYKVESLIYANED